MSIIYHIEINKYEFKDNIVYFDNENDLYLHHKGHTKLPHSYCDKVMI